MTPYEEENEENEILNDPDFIKGYQDYIDGNLIDHDDVKKELFYFDNEQN